MSRLAPAALGAALSLALAAPAHAVTLVEALQNYRANHVAESERQLAEIAADTSASAHDRASALRELGRIDGLMRGESDAIAAAIAQTPDGDEACATAAVALRVYRDAGEPAAALDYAARASGACTPSNADTLRVEHARSLMALAVADAGARERYLSAAAAQMDGVSEPARGAPNVAGARFALAMAQRDANAAFTAWRDYFWLTETDAPQALGAYAGRVHALFTAGLAPNASDGDALALADLLARAGFTADARQYADALGLAARNSDNPAWRRLDSFFSFDAAVRAITLRANREMATTRAPAPWYEGEIQGVMMQMLQANGLEGDPRIVLAREFGIYGTLGETGGYPSLHGGHLVQEETIAVSQYGRSGEVRFIVVDHMLANGFESWLWDGWAEAGGWSSDGNTIVQIRSAYTDGPLSTLRRFRPGPEHDSFLASIERAAAHEREALGRDGVAQLPATADRLLLQAWAQIGERVGDDDSAFIAESWRATNQTSIESHEGRHALDNSNEPGLSDAELEYRAKLSQIIFADYPRLGLASVADGVQNDSPHGIGDRRVLEGYRAWMRRHRNEIAGFDRSQPALSQLDKLSDAQIVAIARSLDPWARSR